jgi:hypothetical protein
MPISELLLPEFDAEMKSTRTMLERVPFDKQGYAPHAKSMKLDKLAGHVAELPGFGASILTTPELDFSTAAASLRRCPSSRPRNCWRLSMKGAAKGARRPAIRTPDQCLAGKLEAELSGHAYLRGKPLSRLSRDVPESLWCIIARSSGCTCASMTGRCPQPTGLRRMTRWASEFPAALAHEKQQAR